MASRGWIVAACGAAAVAGAGAAAATEDVRRVIVEAEVHGAGRTPAEAQREAVQRAREMAVAEVAGIRVSAQQLRLKTEGAEGHDPVAVLDAFASLVRTSTSGRIVREDVVHRTTLAEGLPVYHARLDADVVVEQRSPDPGFVLELRARPDTHTLRDGEVVTLELTASKDCYFTLLNVLGDGTVQLLFPANADDDNTITGGRPTRFPAVRHGQELRVQLGVGRDRDYEQLLAIATLDPVTLHLDVGPRATIEATLEALNLWLVSIPVDRRTEALWDYEIVR